VAGAALSSLLAFFFFFGFFPFCSPLFLSFCWSIISRIDEVGTGNERLDQHHRSVIKFNYRLPLILRWALATFATARPFNATPVRGTKSAMEPK